MTAIDKRGKTMGQAAFKHITGMAAGTQTNPTGKMCMLSCQVQRWLERELTLAGHRTGGQNGDGKQEHCHLAACGIQ